MEPEPTLKVLQAYDPRMDWLRALDLDQANHNCQNDILGDWYRDPWGWPEISWVVEYGTAEFIIPRLDRAIVHRPIKLDVAKENFSIRPAVVLDPVDRLIYQALVDAASVRVQANLKPWAYGWRLVRETPTRGIYARNDLEWQKYRDHLKRLVNLDSAALVTDVVSFFASIPVERFTEDLIDRIGQSELSEALVRRIHEWDAVPGRSGLQQRSAASAALAHMYLEPADRVMSHFNRVSGPAREIVPEGRACRWMDDMWLFGPNEGRLRQAQIALQGALHDIGLNMNLAKTAVLQGDAVAAAVQDLEHSAVDSALEEENTAPLEELLDRIIALPETVSRTTIGFACKRMREYQHYERVDELVEIAHRAPHGADHLARLFRDSEAWRGLADWYVEYSKSQWSSIEWSVAQFGTMFPSSGDHPDVVRDLFVERVRGPLGLPYTAVALQRLGRWDPDEAKLAIRDSRDLHNQALQRRVLAYVAIDVGDERRLVRQLLADHDESAVSLKYLEHRRFRRIPLSRDFG